MVKMYDPRNFRVTFRILDDGEGHDEWNSMLFGIIPSDRAGDSWSIVDGYPRFGWFLTDFGCIWGEDGTYNRVMPELGLGAEFWMHLWTDPLPTLSVGRHFQARALTFNTAIPDCDYMACVILLAEGTKVMVMPHEPSMVDGATEPMPQMLADRPHPDAEVWCHGRVFHIHRQVLSVASPVLRDIFSQETTRRIEITAVGPDPVEAFLQFIYTGDLHENADIVQVLALADFYQIRPLVRACVLRMMGELSADNVRVVWVTLHAWRQNDDIGALWDHFVHRLLTDEEMLRVVLER